MKLRKQPVIAALACSLLASTLSGIGIERFRMDGLVAASDLIAVVDVAEVKREGPAEPIWFRNQLLQAERYSAELTVKRIIKGPALSHAIARYSLPTSFVGYRGLQTGTRIVFLTRRADSYYVADPYYPDFPAVGEGPESAAAEYDYPGRVLTEMLSVIASPMSTPAEKFEILRVDYALPHSPEVVAAFKKGLAGGAEDLKEKLQGELIRFGDLSELSPVVNLLLTAGAAESERVWLLYVIGNRITDHRAIPALRPLLRADDSAVRAAAAQALWHIADRTAVSDLSNALRDPDAQVRFYAVRACADIAAEPGWGGPGEAEFQQHQQKYLAHWQEWAKAQSQ